MESFKTAGGLEKQAFNKNCNALVETHVEIFNRELHVWKTVADQNIGTKSSNSCLLKKEHSTHQYHP